ncbi:MAG TPA: hypothetical protein VE046_13260 [Steroidobacteraceae bacterium]|nr:hypothetical protein [Steroidobacteraceae bacterium]
MFIVSNRVWGPIAGVATALLFVFVLGRDGESTRPAAPAAATRVATTTLDKAR